MGVANTLPSTVTSSDLIKIISLCQSHSAVIIDTLSLTYESYYHHYNSGEVEEDISVAGGEVLELGYEKDNWQPMCKLQAKG